jgi:hypothetical protein
MNVEVNYLAVLVAGIASMVVGYAWYSPVLFGNAWMKATGRTTESMKDEKSQLGKIYSISFILSLLTAYVLTHVMVFSENFFHYSLLTTGITSAIWMWLGFVMPVQATDVLFGGKSFKLFAINTGYQLASLIAMGIVIALFG